MKILYICKYCDHRWYPDDKYSYDWYQPPSEVCDRCQSKDVIKKKMGEIDYYAEEKK